MDISLYFLPETVGEDLIDDCTVLIIDILRASSTINTAFKNLAKCIYPVASVEMARRLQVTKPRALLGGERGGLPPEGFHLGNSPLEYNINNVSNKEIIFTTSNGTKAIDLALSKDAFSVGIGAIINARAAAKWAISQKKTITFLLAGTRGHFSLEDLGGAGAIITEIKEYEPDCKLDDAALLALKTWENYKPNPYNLLTDSSHGKQLLELGFKQDLIYAANLNILNIIAVWRGNRLVVVNPFEDLR